MACTYIQQKPVPFVDLTVFLTFYLEESPESRRLVALLDDLRGSGGRVLMLSEELDLRECSLHVGRLVLADGRALPDVEVLQRLNDEEGSRVEPLRPLALVHVLHEQVRGDAVGVLGLVRADEEDARVHWQRAEVAIQSLVEPDQLDEEGRVRVGDLPPPADQG